MKARFLVSLCAMGAAIAVASCSKGLGNNPETPPGDTSPVSTNRPVGLDIGLQPTDPVTGDCATGIVVPAIGSFPERDLVLLGFTTASSAANGDGEGTALSRDTVTDGNSASDVFLAAICSQDVETRAFSQSLAGKLRHPRCATCHSMQAGDSTAFVSSAISTQTGGFQPHLGPEPGTSFPNNSPEECAECHNNEEFTTFPVKDWQAPDSSFDLRTKTVEELAIAAGNVPADEPRHFITDPRVLWALDSGVLPTRSGRNGVADDDHDGVDEPSDRDGVIRTVPGGSAVFLQQIEEWGQSGFVTTAAGAVCDITLVSRAANVAAAGNGASSGPHLTWVPNTSFAAPGRIGTLFVVYESDATDLITGDTNGATDIFRQAVDLVSDAAGNLDLQVRGNATLVSAVNGGTTVGDGASTMASVGGPGGNLVAFQSLSGSNNLVTGFMDLNGANAPDIYLRNIATNSTELISHQFGNQGNGGNGASSNPMIDATGRAVAFESDASDLIGVDTNTARDIFYADTSGGAAPYAKMRASLTNAGGEGTGGASRNASIYVAGGGRTLVAYESDKTDLAPSLTATTNVYVFDSNTAVSTLLNQQLSSKSAEIGDGSARNPAISADGAHVAFESDATNIDFLRTDENSSTDVFLVDVPQALSGTVLPHRFSMTTIASVDGDGDSTEPCFGSFASASSTFGVGFATYTTEATNLGTPDSTNLMVAFLDETFGVLADFTATPLSGVIPLAVQFTDISVGTPTSWAWDFDNDGTVDSTEQNPLYTYTTAGTFTVKLTATNDAGSDSVTKTDLVVAIGPPTADFSATPTSGPASLAVQFTDTSAGSPTSWLWDFGDGNTSTLQNPMHTYTTVGTYTVELTATNTAGTDTKTETDFVQVFTPVVAGFSPSVTSGTVSFPVTFTNTSTGASSYLWDFGDGSATVTTESPTHTYTSSGSFTVTLTATGEGGVDTDTTTITSNGVVTASFTISVDAGGPGATSGYEASTINLDATASANATGFSWTISAGGGSLASTSTPSGNIGTLFPTSDETTYTITLNTSGPGGNGVAMMSFTSVADSETININDPSDVEDAFIRSDNGASNTGTATELIIGKTYTAGYRRSVIKFSLSDIPASSTINTASLKLYDKSPNGTATGGSHTGSQLTGTQSFDIRRITTSWSEGTVTFNSPWTLAGGDSAAATTTIGSTNAQNLSVVTSGDLSSDVQLWINGTANNGWLLRHQTETGLATLATIKWYGSKNSVSAGERPTLTVNYTRPLP